MNDPKPSASQQSPASRSQPLSDKEQAARDEQILAAFHGNIQRVATPLSYRIGILLVAVTMIILPLIYLAIVAAVCYGVYYHAVHHAGLLGMGRGRGAVMVVIVYAAPIVIGGILILFMMKPLLSGFGGRVKRKPLSRHEQSLLFAFVERICAAVRAPKPRRIEIDCQVNASASFRSGILSMLSDDLVLTIGMPLVAGLNLRQFAGVMAHEFGHFSQGAGMRLTYIIRVISHWFTRVVYERDQWDERLVEYARSSDLRIGWILYLAQFFVWITRRILWVLMIIGHAVSGFMLRQMEFDADRYEARLAGSQEFESTMRRITSLSIATQGAYADLEHYYREGRLGDDLPVLIIHNADRFTPEIKDNIRKLVDESTTGYFDTHPSDKDRIASTRRENTAGIFQLELPASELFRDFEGLCQRVTWEYYQEIFGTQLKREDIHPIGDLLQRHEEEQRVFDSLHRCLQDTFRSDRTLRLPSWQVESPQDVGRAVARLKSTREQMLQSATEYRAVYQQCGEARPEQREHLEQQLQPFEEIVGDRLLAGLQLLKSRNLDSKLADARQAREEAAKLLPVLRILEQQLASVLALGGGTANLASLFDQISESNDEQGLYLHIQSQMELNGKLILESRETLKKIEYPFDHARGKISVGEFAVSMLPDANNPGEIYEAGQKLVESVAWLRARLLGHLCLLLEQVEAALGWEPLPEPPGAEDDKVTG